MISFNSNQWKIVKPPSTTITEILIDVVIISISFHKLHSRIGAFNISNGTGWGLLAAQTNFSIEKHGNLCTLLKPEDLNRFIWGDEANIFVIPSRISRRRHIWLIDEWRIASLEIFPKQASKSLARTILYGETE